MIHIELLKSLIDVAQEAGRGGRSALQTHANYTLLFAQSDLQKLQYTAKKLIGQDTTPIEADQLAVLEFLEPSTSSIVPACQRTALSEYLDGSKNVTCNTLKKLSPALQQINILLCDLCSARKAQSMMV